MKIAIAELYCGKSGKKGFYNNQEIGLAKAFKKLGHEICIMYPEKTIQEEKTEIVEDGITICYMPAKTIGVHAKYDWSVLKRKHIDAVQLGADNQIFAPDFMRYCDKNKIPIYAFIGTTKTDSPSKVKKALLDLLYRRNIKAYKKHQCFAKTPRVAEELKADGIPNVKIAPVGLDLTLIPKLEQTSAELRQLLNLPEKKKTVLFVARMDDYKHPLEAVNLLSSLSDEFHLVMIGTGALDEQVEQAIQKNNLAQRVTRIKQIENKKIHAYYKAADYFVNFNQNEIFGMSILEAMYHECTVLACHAPGPDFIIENKISGFLVQDTAEMKQLLAASADIPAGAAKKRILENFVWDKTAEIFSKWLENSQDNIERVIKS